MTRGVKQEIDSPLDIFTVAELKAFAEEYGTDLKPGWNKPEIAKALEDDGIDFDFLQEKIAESAAADDGEFDAPDLGGPEVVVDAPTETDDDEDLMLIKMVRANNSYEIRGHRFTREHPFALMNSGDADYLIEVDGGFQMASPREAQEYYR